MEEVLQWFSQKQVFGVILIVVFALIVYKVINILIDKISFKTKNEYDKKKKKTIIELLRNFIKYAIVIITVITILDLFGVNVNSIVASLGVFSAVAALSLQDTLKDIVSGCMIIVDNYYMVGDYITFDGFTGQVIQMSLRTTKIMNADKKVLTVSNRNIDKIVNISEKNSSMLIEAPTAYEAKTEEVEKIINEIVEEIKTWPHMDKEKTTYIGITELGDSCVKYGIRFYCHTQDSWQYQRDILRLIKLKYDENNIKIPYPQLEVHNG